MDFEIQNCSRRCSQSGRDLRPGEAFFSVLLPEGPDVVRRDFATEAWTGPPENAIGWWKSQLPDDHSRKLTLAPNDVLLRYLAELDGQADKLEVRYLLALMLVRRRLLRIEGTKSDDAGREWLVLLGQYDEQLEFQVAVAMPPPERAEAIQQELSRVLYA